MLSILLLLWARKLYDVLLTPILFCVLAMNRVVARVARSASAAASTAPRRALNTWRKPSSWMNEKDIDWNSDIRKVFAWTLVGSIVQHTWEQQVQIPVRGKPRGPYDHFTGIWMWPLTICAGFATVVF